MGFDALRRSFTSNLARASSDDRAMDRFTGHRTEEMARRYQRLFPEEKRKALGRLDY